jgi:DNA repair protein RadA/Sms
LKARSIYVCSACGYTCAKWQGKCPGCGEWNTLAETVAAPQSPAAKSSARSLSQARDVGAFPLSGISAEGEHRYKTGLRELDRVLGGGIVKGSLVLLGGDPGIGKSTLLLQICQTLGRELSVLYVSGEESGRQLKLRAERLGVDSPDLLVMAETDCETICEYIRRSLPGLVMIDSIQTVSMDGLTSSPGSIVQVRECTNAFMRLAKMLDIPIIIVSHVNKDGQIAGPKALEHIVDAVLYFEGERTLSYRILRAIKNRYGSTNEIGVFEMRDRGLNEVENPSLMLLSGRPKNVPGTCVVCLLEGSRPILAEVQGLVSTSGFGNARRMANGFDLNRLNMLLAVLEKRAGYFFANLDAYINVVGGLRLDEPAADLTVALALVSSLKDFPVPEDVIAFGEVGLAGEIRAVSQCAQRAAEAARLGFKRCILPASGKKSAGKIEGMEIVGVKSIREAFEALK